MGATIWRRNVLACCFCPCSDGEEHCLAYIPACMLPAGRGRLCISSVEQQRLSCAGSAHVDAALALCVLPFKKRKQANESILYHNTTRPAWVFIALGANNICRRKRGARFHKWDRMQCYRCQADAVDFGWWNKRKEEERECLLLWIFFFFSCFLELTFFPNHTQ